MTTSDRELEALPREGSDPWQGTVELASPAMRTFVHLLSGAARHHVPVLLVGERGTGKTTFARALHAMSARAQGPFVCVDCLATTGDLSAEAQRALGGTLFLDEVAGLPPAAQAGALRFLQDSGPLPLRLVASTHRDLEAEAAAGRFRKDLFYRLDVLELRVPPLRERAEDILPLARAFVSAQARRRGEPPAELSPALERALLRYAWPGNVPELFSVMERALILSSGTPLDTAALPDRIAG